MTTLPFGCFSSKREWFACAPRVGQAITESVGSLVVTAIMVVACIAATQEGLGALLVSLVSNSEQYFLDEDSDS